MGVGRDSQSTCAEKKFFWMSVHASNALLLGFLPRTAYLVVNQAPLFQKAVDAQDGAGIARQVAAAGGDGQVLRRVQPIRINHEIAICHVAIVVHGKQEGERGGVRYEEKKDLQNLMVMARRLLETYTSGALLRFLPLKNSGSARTSTSCNEL